MTDPKKAAESFLREAHQFHLGKLPTETPHEKTKALSQLAQSNLREGIATLKQVDIDALSQITKRASQIDELRSVLQRVLARGDRVYLCGCGATGRLSLSLEVLWRESTIGAAREQVVSFMAGGDLALMRSIENFEDHPEYGARQLEELGFKEGDILVSCTEGGETPFVIGATEHATRLSKEPPWFLYCNPDEVLCEVVERSRRVITNPCIKKINLSVGSMGLSGSTRMQASTVLMLAVGLALLPETASKTVAAQGIASLAQKVASTDFNFLAPFTIAESDVYKAQGFTLYETDVFGITILTDTTERSPTFSLRGFENLNDRERLPSLCYLHMIDTNSAEEAFRKLLHRAPRPLEWEGISNIAGLNRLLGFDFSKSGAENREKLVTQPKLTRMTICEVDGNISWRFAQHTASVSVQGLTLLEKHLLLKMMLNIHSTLIMGRLGRFESNLMTYVRPSNKKLIDRAVRYADALLQLKHSKKVSYEDLTRRLFEIAPILRDDEPIVLKIVESFS